MSPRPLLFALVAVLCLGTAALLLSCEATDAEVQKPSGMGPFPVGNRLDTIRTSTKDYDTPVKVFYPAFAHAANADPDATRGPYMTVIWLPGFGGDREGYQFLIDHLASYGAVVVAVSVNWNDFPNSCNGADLDDILDWLEVQNTTGGSYLERMIDTTGYGISGHSSGGGLSLVGGAQVDRIHAVLTYSAAINVGAVDSIAPMYEGKALLLEVGENDDNYIQGSLRAFEKVGAPVSIAIDTGVGHGGPWNLHLLPSFYLYHLAGDTDYRTFLYGLQALDDVFDDLYELRFKLSEDLFFPPEITASVGATSIPMDSPVALNATIRGYHPLNYPNIVFEWDVDGDGAPDETVHSDPNTTHEFTEVGTFSVSVTYGIGPLRVHVPKAGEVAVHNVPPVAVAGEDVTVVHDSHATFDGAMSYDTRSDMPTLQYMWSFSDGVTTPWSSLTWVHREFHEVGLLTAMLWVRDRNEALATDQLNVTVLNVPPRAEAGHDLSVEEDGSVRLVGSAIDNASDMDSLRYRWDFGDGQGVGWTSDPGAFHIYHLSGNYTATFHVRDPNGAEASDGLTVKVVNVAPQVTLALPAEGTRVVEDALVEFYGVGNDTISDIDYLLYMWDFGDGEGTDWLEFDEVSVEHSYWTSGNYRVTLTVRDDNSDEATATVLLEVENVAPLARILEPGSRITVEEAASVTFRGLGSDTPTDEGLLVMNWSVGWRVQEGASMTHVFDLSGTYHVVFAVSDPEGEASLATVEVTVTNVPPTVDGSLTADRIASGDTVDFEAVGFDTLNDQGDLSFHWDFGDGSNSTRANGSHAYTVPGTYNVTLTVTDDDGASASKAFTVVVEEPYTPPPPEDVEDDDGDDGSRMGTLYLLVFALATLYCILATWHFFARERPQFERSDLEPGIDGEADTDGELETNGELDTDGEMEKDRDLEREMERRGGRL